MRTITVVALGFVLLIALGIGAFVYINTSAKEMGEQLQALETTLNAQNWQVSMDNLNTAKQSWEKTKWWWSILLDHQEIDNIDISINRLEKYVESMGLSLALGELSALEMLVDHISDKEMPNFRNIL